MWINFLKPTNTQTTWKTIRGMVTKNLIALMLTGHPLGLIENLIHTPVDRIVNKKFCTDNKLLNVWVHLATCLSVDGLIHGSGHELAESLMSDGWWHAHGSTSSDVVWSENVWSDSTTSADSVSADWSDDTTMDSSESVSESTMTSPTIDEMWQGRGRIWAAMDKMDHSAHFAGDGHDHWIDLIWWEEMWDTHAGHDHGDSHGHVEHGDYTDHGDHDDHSGHSHGEHDHGWHGVLPILWWAIVEEYGPTMYKITKKRTQWLLSRMFNYDTGSEQKIIKKSDLAKLGNKEVSKLKGRQIKFEPNIIWETKKQSWPQLTQTNMDRGMAA